MRIEFCAAIQKACGVGRYRTSATGARKRPDCWVHRFMPQKVRNCDNGRSAADPRLRQGSSGRSPDQSQNRHEPPSIGCYRLKGCRAPGAAVARTTQLPVLFEYQTEHSNGETVELLSGHDRCLKYYGTEFYSRTSGSMGSFRKVYNWISSRLADQWKMAI
jgi:hypothetical protein